jgi:ornithine--oxo-acid transaminase
VNQRDIVIKIVNAMIETSTNMTLTSRAFHNMINWVFFEEFVTKYFGLTGLPMNTVAEAVETA